MSAQVSTFTVFHVACPDCGWGIGEFDDWRARDAMRRHNAEFHGGIQDPRVSVHDLAATLSSQITAALGSDDWVIVHRGHNLVDAAGLDALAAERSE